MLNVENYSPNKATKFKVKMHFLVNHFAILSALLNIHVRASDFPFEYFRHKSVSRVNLFSCEETEDDFRFVKKMNELGISVAVHHPNLQSYNVSDEIIRKDYWPFGLFMDTRCQTEETTVTIMTQTSKHRLYEGIHIWLILGDNLTRIVELLNDTTYNPQTDIAIGIPNENGYDIYDVYNPSKPDGGTLYITNLGFWNSLEGVRITLTGSKFTRRSNLRGMVIKAVAVAKYLKPGTTIEDYLLDYTKKSKDFVSKYGYAILLHVGDLFNFTMKIKYHEDWLSTLNGTEVGALAMLSRGEADIHISPTSASERYIQKPYGQMLGPGYPYRSFFIFHAEGTEKMKWTELLTPFAVDSWYAIFVTVSLSIVIITAIQSTEFREGWFAELGHAIFATVGAFCQQGLVFVPNRLAGRVAFLFLLFLSVLLFNYYGASIVSSRLSEPPNKINDSLYALAKRRMTLTSEPYRYIDILLPHRALTEWESHYFYYNIWKKLPTTKYVTVEEGMPKVGNSYAYHTTPEVAYPYIENYWTEKAICDMTEVTVITPRVLSFWDKVDSPFSELLRVGLCKVTDMGLRTRNIKRWKPKTPYCSPDARTLQSITIFDIAPALMLVVAGSVMALGILCVEILTFKLIPTNTGEDARLKKPRVGGKRTLLRA